MTALLTLIKSPLLWLALLALAGWGVYEHQAKQVLNLRAQLQTAQRDLAGEQRAHDQLKQANKATESQAKGTATNDKQTTAQLGTVARAADHERAGRLRDSQELAGFIERNRTLAQSAADAEQRAAAADQALGVCADLLGRVDAAAGDLAGYADELGARIEGAERWSDLTADTINAGPEGQGQTLTP